MVGPRLPLAAGEGVAPVRLLMRWTAVVAVAVPVLGAVAGSSEVAPQVMALMVLLAAEASVMSKVQVGGVPVLE